MTTPPASAMPQGAPSGDDHDLLTYGVAGDRLREEIDLENRALDAADASGDDADAEKCRARISDLEAAFRRHAETRNSEFNERQFFGELFESGPRVPASETAPRRGPRGDVPIRAHAASWLDFRLTRSTV